MLGGTPEENAQITRDILSGKITGPKRDVVQLNAGAGLYIAGKARSIAAGVDMAGDLIDDGSAYRKIDEFVEASRA